MIAVMSYCCSCVESPLPSSKTILLLISRPSSLSRLGNRSDEVSATPALNDLLRRLTVVVKLPVPFGIFVRRVKDRMIEKGIAHRSLFSPITTVDQPLLGAINEAKKCPIACDALPEP